MLEKFCNGEEKAATCIVAHIKAFRDQAAEERVADYGEPCKICPCAKNCEHKWLSIMLPLLKKSKLKINMDF